MEIGSTQAQRPVWVALLAVSLGVALSLGGGCGRKEAPRTAGSTTETKSPAAKPESEVAAKTVLAVHWLGKGKVTPTTNATPQAEIWRLPESEALEKQTLDKLAVALSRYVGLTNRATNEITRGLRPLLDDLVQAESFIEVQSDAGRASQLTLAIRLSPERAALWRTNLESVSSLKPADEAGMRRLDSLQLAQDGEWTLVALRCTPDAQTNTVGFAALTNLVQRLESRGPEWRAGGSGWLTVEAELGHWLRSNAVVLATNLPTLNLSVRGDGNTVRTKGELVFHAPLRVLLPAWNIPTNLIHEPLVSFTTMRGIRAGLEATRPWLSLQAGSAPDQLCTWALDRIPFQTYFACPWADSSNRFHALTDRWMAELNPFLVSNRWGKVSPLPGTNGIEWAGTPIFQPFLAHHTGPDGDFVTGGFSQLLGGKPMPEDLFNQFSGSTNLLYYDWEMTGARMPSILYLSQALRLISGRAQLDVASPGIKWLLAVAPKLGNAVTAVTLTQPARINFLRTSTLGATCVELNLLVDWLESPSFPDGLHTFMSPPPARLSRPGDGGTAPTK